MAIATVLFSILAILSLPIPLWSLHYRIITGWSYSYIFFGKWVCGVHYQVTGAENIPDRAAIAAVKHQSSWETLFMQVLLPPQSWILKRELLFIPIFGWTLALLKPIAINRQNRKSALQQILEQGKYCLTKGRWVVIFPEGTRVQHGQKHYYSRSASTLAMESQALLLPVAHNAGKYWNTGFIKRPGTIQIVVGTPLNPSQHTRDSLHIEMATWIEQTSSLLT